MKSFNLFKGYKDMFLAQANNEHLNGNNEHLNGNNEHLNGNNEHLNGNNEHLNGMSLCLTKGPYTDH